MPWTFSHPAVVFPLKQSRIGKYLNLPALVVGSTSPDLLYSFGLYQSATTAHNLVGWFYTAFPFCLLVFIFNYWLRNPLKTVSPIPLDNSIRLNWRDLSLFVISLYLGAVTHIVWDSFTHETGTAVRIFSILQTQLLQGMTDSQELAIYKLLQHLGSVLGLIYLCWKYVQYQRKQECDIQLKNRLKLFRLIGIGLISGLCTFPLAWQNADKGVGINVNRFIFLELSLAVPFFFGLIIILGLWLYSKQKKQLF
ncbi:DUF4184 family protein [Proteus mirabilis]|uniref:DUF4184 family protein n=1 Tax=Proteus mirabilis TaxID=584 RepID=UPI001A301721|nr:DUF4184 family protein [Proteus mirabilis]MBI6250630.1 DUF4184 family protein [Proteus mirabilis]MBI6288290.1 DUF4184 family protein [Proteus mirabilis]MCS6718306.1 DUF4184 family protein [Proteus mirabilis]MCS6722969.1 DUF4184 family protein [Proteus mirabilis]MCS6729092.1 DUF4184 family protein [Proteus mirabilis]